MLPILLRFGPFKAYTWGAMVSLGGALSFAFLYTKRRGMGFQKDESFWLFINVVLIGGALGGRLLHIIEYVPFSSPDFWSQAFSAKTGFSVMGAFLVAVCGVFLLCGRLGIGFLRVWDHFSLVLPLWHFFGRLGCLGAGCCHGRTTDVPWAITYRDVPGTLVAPASIGIPVHPTQLYEGLAELAFLPVLYYALFRPMERGGIRPGYVAAAYLGFYSVLRFFNEFYRADTVPIASLGITMGQVITLGYSAGAVAIAVWVRRQNVPHPS